MRFRTLVFLFFLLPFTTLVRADALSELKLQANSVVYADGILKFHAAIEHLGQSLYRFGLTPPQSRDLGMVLPVLRYPVPLNPNPDKIDYASFRGILETLVTDLDASESSLAAAGEVDVKLPINLQAVGIDFNKDGKYTPDEMLPSILSALLGPPQGAIPDMTVKFDTADIYWVRGYGRFISSFAQFMLAHDFEDTFNKTFHLYFPRAGLAVGDKLASSRSAEAWIDGNIGDAIAFIHLINWKTADPARLADVRTRLIAMADMSVKSWQAARKETDNDREWMPNGKQTQAITGQPSNDDTIDGWLAVMGEFKAVLEGEKLMPHWRFNKGMNVKRFFTESKGFDLVLLVAGTDAVLWLEDGPVSNLTRWNELTQVFENNFLGYALWYN